LSKFPFNLITCSDWPFIWGPCSRISATWKVIWVCQFRCTSPWGLHKRRRNSCVYTLPFSNTHMHKLNETGVHTYNRSETHTSVVLQ
jgi:hypothetical protein